MHGQGRAGVPGRVEQGTVYEHPVIVDRILH